MIRRRTTHPGEVLLQEYIKRGITADTALRFSRRFRTSPEFWMNLQSAYELTEARLAIGAD